MHGSNDAQCNSAQYSVHSIVYEQGTVVQEVQLCLARTRKNMIALPVLSVQTSGSELDTGK